MRLLYFSYHVRRYFIISGLSIIVGTTFCSSNLRMVSVRVHSHYAGVVMIRR